MIAAQAGTDRENALDNVVPEAMSLITGRMVDPQGGFRCGRPAHLTALRKHNRFGNRRRLWVPQDNLADLA